jgi:hypothetical protein
MVETIDYNAKLAEIDERLENLKGMDTTDPAIASSIGALHGEKLKLLNEFGAARHDGRAGRITEARAELSRLSGIIAEAKGQVVEAFNQAGQALQLLRDTEYELIEARKAAAEEEQEAARIEGRPFQPYAGAAIFYPAINKRSMGALDSWWGIFAAQYGKLAVRVDQVRTVNQEELIG